MGRTPCCSKLGLNRGAWTAMEDQILTAYIKAHGEGKWRTLPKRAGLKRCGKSCRLRWLNYLKPGIKRGNISPDEDDLIIKLHNLLGNRWSLIAGRLPGRTDNEIKNYWNTRLSKKIGEAGPVAEKSSPRKPKAREPVSAKGKVSKTLVSALPAAIRTKARRVTKKLLPNATATNGDSVLKSAKQTAVDQLTEQLNQENVSKEDNLQVAHYDDLDSVKFNSSGCFDVCDNHVENELCIKTDDLCLVTSKYQQSVDDHTTSAWTPSDFFEDMNSTIDLGALVCFLDNKEELMAL